MPHRLTAEERQRIMLTCNQPQYASLQPSQIVSVWQTRGSLSVQRAASTGFSTTIPSAPTWSRHGPTGAQKSSKVAGHRSKRGVELGHLRFARHGEWALVYLYMVIDVWSRKLVAWDVDEREDPSIEADLVSRACLRERISKGRAGNRRYPP